MNTLLLKTLAKKTALMLISRKLNENPEDIQNSDFNKKLIPVAGSGLALIVAGLIQFGVAQGWIDKSLIDMIISALG